VVLRTTTPGGHDQAEVILRNALLAERLHQGANLPIVVGSIDEGPSDHQVNVLHGSVEALGSQVRLTDGRLWWRGAPVRVLLNPALVVELANAWGVGIDDVLTALPEETTIDGAAHTSLSLDLVRQQRRAADAGFAPVEIVRCHFGTAHAIDEALELAARHGRAAIVPNGAPAGVGAYEVQPGEARHDVIAHMRPALRTLDVIYGPGWARTTPLVACEIPQARARRSGEEPEDWALRIQVVPGRLGPEATFTLGYVGEGDDRTILGPDELIGRTGLTQAELALLSDTAVTWHQLVSERDGESAGAGRPSLAMA
jgi:hypothetical protein